MIKVLLLDFSNVLFHLEEIIFVDNMVENVNAALNVGVNAIHFENRERLTKELEKYLN